MVDFIKELSPQVMTTVYYVTILILWAPATKIMGIKIVYFYHSTSDK
jgi:hypothetical protein